MPQEDQHERLLIEKDGNFIELEKFEYLVVDKEEHKFQIKNTNYLTQLKDLTSDCESFKFKNPVYTDLAITKTLSDYCLLKSGMPIVNKTPKPIYQFFVVPSANLSASSYYFGLGARIYSRKGAKNIFTGADFNLLSLKDKYGILPSFDMYVGANTRQKTKFKVYFQTGFAISSKFRYLWITPTLGVNYRQFIFLEIKRFNSLLPGVEIYDPFIPISARMPKVVNFNALTLRIGPVFSKK